MKRDCRLPVRLTQKELNMLSRKARAARITTSAFVRSAISGTEVYEAPTVDVMLLLRELRRVGYNVNQILRRANSSGIVDMPRFRKDMEEVRRAAEAITKAYGVLYHGCSTPPCIGKSKTAENIGEGGLPVEIIVQEQGKLVTVWLNRKEQENSALRERLKSLYAGYAEKKYTVAEFLSGGEELYHNTRDLLLYNRRKLAEAEVQREKLEALPGNTGSQRRRPIVQWE